jgi:hypothetical protein
MTVPTGYPATLEIDYPDPELNRFMLTTDRYPPFSVSA